MLAGTLEKEKNLFNFNSTSVWKRFSDTQTLVTKAPYCRSK